MMISTPLSRREERMRHRESHRSVAKRHIVGMLTFHEGDFNFGGFLIN